MVNEFPANLYDFYIGVYEAVDDPSSDSMISWSESNQSFILWNPVEFQRRILRDCPKILCLSLTRFFSQLQIFGFKKVKGSKHLEFGHKEYFVRGRPDLLKKMQKKVFAKHCRRVTIVRNEAEAVVARKMDVEDRFHHLRI